jgi:aspartate/methionine/tyrosine aminotransferase
VFEKPGATSTTGAHYLTDSASEVQSAPVVRPAAWHRGAMKTAGRSKVAPFYVMEVMRAAAERERQGQEVLHLEVGQPSTPAPSKVLEAARVALTQDVLGYTNALGVSLLRERIAGHHADWYGDDIDAEQVAVTLGASGACNLVFLACFDPGDRVAMAAPGYPAYRNMLTALSFEVVDLAVDASTRFQPTPEVLEAHLPLDGLVVASPSNPTGTMIDAPAMKALCSWCDANGVRLISDEIYHGITYGDDAVSARSHSASAVVVNSFSKYFSMTGWRVGWLVLPDELHDPVERLAQNLFISAPTLSQIAAVAAFDCHDELRANVERYRSNRAVLLDGLPRSGLDRLAPADGAFYVYADVSEFTDDSQALCAVWLSELGLAATPGIDFDPASGNRYVRFSFAGSEHDMEAAVDRLSSWAAGRARSRQ